MAPMILVAPQSSTVQSRKSIGGHAEQLVLEFLKRSGRYTSVCLYGIESMSLPDHVLRAARAGHCCEDWRYRPDIIGETPRLPDFIEVKTIRSSGTASVNVAEFSYQLDHFKPLYFAFVDLARHTVRILSAEDVKLRIIGHECRPTSRPVNGSGRPFYLVNLRDVAEHPFGDETEETQGSQYLRPVGTRGILSVLAMKPS